MKNYRGVRTGNNSLVYYTNDNAEWKELPLRLDLANHSPTGFEWGYGGSGPAQLALAILADCCGDDFALANYQQFKWDVVATIKANYWVLDEEELERWKTTL